jgi:hypothetical protein
MLFYAAPKVGKTWLAGTAGDRNVIVSNRNGITTLQSATFQKKYPCNPQVEFVDTDFSPDSPSGFNEVKKIIDKIFQKQNLASFDFLTLDDFSFINRMAIIEAVRMNGSESKSRTHTQAAKFMGEVIPAQQDLGTAYNLIDSFLVRVTSECREHKKHLIVLNQERHIYRKKIVVLQNGTTKEEEELWRIMPQFGGREYPDKALNHFDLIARLTSSPTTSQGGHSQYQIKMQFSPTLLPRIEVGDRYSVFKDFEVNLTIPEIVKRITESRTPKPTTNV